MNYDREMQRALELDGEKLRQITGEDHGPFCPTCLGRGEVGWFDHAEGAWRNEPCPHCSTLASDEDYPGQAPCPHCFESSGYAARRVSATWTDPAYDEADPTRPCPYCNGTGTVDSDLVTLEDLEEQAEEEAAR